MFQYIHQNNTLTEYAVSRVVSIRINHVPETLHPMHTQCQEVVQHIIAVIQSTSKQVPEIYQMDKEY